MSHDFSYKSTTANGYDVFSNGLKIKGDYKIEEGEDKLPKIIGNNLDIKGTAKDDNFSVFGNENTITGYGGGDHVSIFGQGNLVKEKASKDFGENVFNVVGDNNILNTSSGTKLNVKGDSNSIFGGEIFCEGNKNSIEGTMHNDKISVNGLYNVINGRSGKDDIEVKGAQNTVIQNGVSRENVVLYGDGTNDAISKRIGQADVFDNKQINEFKLEKQFDGKEIKVYNQREVTNPKLFSALHNEKSQININDSGKKLADL